METVRLSVNDLAVNKGQIEGLPVNPRQWTKADVDKLAKSLQETPELFEMRPCIVVPYSGKYIVLGGNMRLTAAQSLKLKDVPCIVMPENTPVDKLKEIVLKDNGSFGAWDFDSLANEWGDLPLTEWGVPAWNTDVIADDDLLSKSDSRGANAVSFGGEGFKMVLGNRTYFVSEGEELYEYCKELEEKMDDSEGNEVLKDILCEILIKYTSLKN